MPYSIDGETLNPMEIGMEVRSTDSGPDHPRPDALMRRRPHPDMMLDWRRERQCGICGHPVDITSFASWCIVGRTLDGHDMTPTNDLILYEVDRCPNCGFCSPTIDDPRDITRDDVIEPVYRRMLETRSPHECAAYLLSIHGHHRDAAYMLLHSAWLHEENSTWLRSLAIREMLKEPPEEDDLIVMADMLRCIGDLERAKTVVDTILSEKDNASLWKRAVKELELIGSGNTRSNVIYEDDWEKTIDDVIVVSQKNRTVIGKNLDSPLDTDDGLIMHLWLQRERITDVWSIDDIGHPTFCGCSDPGISTSPPRGTCQPQSNSRRQRSWTPQT